MCRKQRLRTCMSTRGKTPNGWTTWREGNRSVDQLGMVGSKYRLVPKKGDMVFVATVLARSLPSELHLSLEAENVSVSVKGLFTPLSPTSTRLTHEQVFTFKGAFNKVFGIFARPAIRKAQRRHIDAFKRFAEARQ